jgi:predicted Fe-Mo cluster-binding NifX family protein
MKLCFPTLSDNENEAVICDHFGSSPYFVLFDQKTKEYELISNPGSTHEQGQCRPMELLAERGIVAVVCKAIGRSAAAAIDRQNIKVFMTQGETVGEAIAEFMAGSLVKFDPAMGCKGHNCHSG